MSYCRITGKARGLPKSNYFPLLPPISAADARRFCRITGKAYGLPTHCYIPVVLSTTFSKKSKCKITHSVGFVPHNYEGTIRTADPEYGQREHIVLGDYRYLLPVLDENNDHQKSLFEILNSKTVQCEDESYFIYAIKEQKCNLVFPAKLEAAVRDGDVRDVMFAKTNDSVLLCMNKGKSVSLDLQDYELDSENVGIERKLFEGEGPSHDVLLARENEENSKHQRSRTKNKKNDLRKIKTIDVSACTSANENLPNNCGSEERTEELKSDNANCNGWRSKTQQLINEMNNTDQKHCAERNDGDCKKRLELNHAKLCESIPNQSEILKIMQNYSKGTVVYDHQSTSSSSSSSISGLNINIGTDEAPRNVLILGCIVNTSDGDVFVAGRTVVTENNATIFEPGIYVQSKNGPVFIPGQIIQCEEGERFVPGQIIDTEFGPRFVPGKIVELDGEVVFNAAQIVQTDQGPKFIAQDLCDGDDDVDEENGERNYSVQSFLFSPEEMTLLKPMHLCLLDQNVDVNMFNHLSEAGIVVGSKIEVSNEDVGVLLENAMKEQIIKKFAENLGYTAIAKQSSSAFEGLFDTIKTLVKMTIQSPQHIFGVSDRPDNAMLSDDNVNLLVNENDALGQVDLRLVDIISRTVIDCLVYHQAHSDSPIDHPSLLYEVIGQTLLKNFKQYHGNLDSATKVTACFNEIEKLLSSPETMAQVENSVKLLSMHSIKINKVDMVKALLTNDRTVDRTKTDISFLESIQSVMGNKTVDELFESIRNLIHEPSSSLMTQIINDLKQQINISVVDEITFVETLRNCIVSAVQHSTDDEIKKSTQTHDASSVEKLNSYLTDTLSLARALGFTDCILHLSNVINSNDRNETIAQALMEHEKSYELLQRVIVMHKFAKNDEERTKAIQSLRNDPYSSRSDLVLRELLRSSGICTINLEVEGNGLKDSNDVPISLIYSGNQLAIEDFFMRKQSKPSGPILIVKDRFQAVVPREASRNVLTGKCAYTVLDEHGIRRFEPLHMFTALKLKNINMFEDRFSSYSKNQTNDEKISKDCDIDIESILKLGAYKSTILPAKYIAQRLPSSHGLLFNRSQVNYRRSFYL